MDVTASTVVRSFVKCLKHVKVKRHTFLQFTKQVCPYYIPRLPSANKFTSDNVYVSVNIVILKCISQNVCVRKRNYPRVH